MREYNNYFDSDDAQCCGICKYHRKEKSTGDWICSNERSDCYGCVTEYKDVCNDCETRY